MSLTRGDRGWLPYSKAAEPAYQHMAEEIRTLTEAISKDQPCWGCLEAVRVKLHNALAYGCFFKEMHQGKETP